MNLARVYHQQIKNDFIFYASTIVGALLKNKKYKEALTSLKYTIKRYGFSPVIFISFFRVIIGNFYEILLSRTLNLLQNVKVKLKECG